MPIKARADLCLSLTAPTLEWEREHAANMYRIRLCCKNQLLTHYKDQLLEIARNIFLIFDNHLVQGEKINAKSKITR
jgi:hypothetical protein